MVDGKGKMGVCGGEGYVGSVTRRMTITAGYGERLGDAGLWWRMGELMDRRVWICGREVEGIVRDVDEADGWRWKKDRERERGEEINDGRETEKVYSSPCINYF